MLSIWFQNLKSSSTWFNSCFPLRRVYLLLYCWVSLPILSILEANTCINCVHWFLHVYLLHLLYCFMLTTIHEIYMLQVESNCWNLIILCVASKLSTKNLLLYELTLMQDLLMLVLKVLFMKSLCYMIQLFNHCLYHCFESLHSLDMLHNSIDQDYDSMSLQKLSLLSFTYSRASRN